MNMIEDKNPFLETYSTPHGTVPFDRIKTVHYEPAVREGISRQNGEIAAITDNPEAPTFANTILPYERSGELLQRTVVVFDNLLSAETSDEMQELAKTIMLIEIPLELGRAVNIVMCRALQACGDIRFPITICVISAWLTAFGGGVLLSGPLGLGLAGLWIAMACDECLRAGLFLWRWHTRTWSRIRLAAAYN